MGAGDEIKAYHYRDRAESFLRGMVLLSDESYVGDEAGKLLPAAALLAVHAGIALGDAVLVLKTGKRSTAQNHREAVGTLRAQCAKSKVDDAGVSHLSQLIADKDYFAYGDRRVATADIQSAIVQAQRFAAWTYRSFPELAAGGPHDASGIA